MAGGVNAWLTDRPGIDQGRVDPEGWDPPEGDHALVLGADRPGWERRFVVGNQSNAFQSVALGASKIVRCAARVRGPSRMPAAAQAAEPYALADGQTLIIAIDGGAPQTIAFQTADFASIGAARAHEVRDAINAQLTGAAASLTGTGEVQVFSDTTGRRSRVAVQGGTAAALMLRELVWLARITIDGILAGEVPIRPGELRDLGDFAGNVPANDPFVLGFHLVLGTVTVLDFLETQDGGFVQTQAGDNILVQV
jgi:hypothetical protein